MIASHPHVISKTGKDFGRHPPWWTPHAASPVPSQITSPVPTALAATPGAGMRQPPNDRRGFIHKRIIGAVGGFIGGGPGGAIGGFIGGGRQPRIPTRGIGPPVGRCNPPFVSDGRGGCVAQRGGILGPIQRAVPGGSTGLLEEGAPATVSVTRRVCGRGQVLRWDGMCVRRKGLSNKDRFWPAPRRPLLTGGDLNAIATAARAARRMQTASKRLQKLGMLPKPKSSSRRRSGGHQHLIAAAPTTLKVISEETN